MSVTSKTGGAMTVQDLVAEALQGDLELKQLRAELGAAGGERRAAGAIPGPELSGGVGRTSLHEDGLRREGLEYSLSLQQPLEWPGRRNLRKAIADEHIALTEIRVQQAEAQVAARVRRLAFGLSAAGKRAVAAREVATRLAALRDVLLKRDPRGPVALLETRIIEAAELTMARKAGLAEQAEQEALYGLNQARGLEADAAPPFRHLEAEFLAPLPAAELLPLALKHSRELRSREKELLQAELRLGLAKHERLPTMTLGPALEVNELDQESTLSLQMSLPLALWDLNRGAIDLARARQLQANLAVTEEERGLKRRVIAAHHAYSARLRDLSGRRPDLQGHFRKAAETADSRYRMGAVPVGGYVEMQEKYVEAIESLTETEEDALAAALELDLLTGRTPPLARLTVKGEMP